jgi:(p)ppGpp synthase/HD superfamily hydrolase
MQNNYDIQADENAEHVFDAMEPREISDGISRVREAYESAGKVLKNQRRNSGEPYISHPIAEVRIAAEELMFDANPVAEAESMTLTESPKKPL